MGFSERENTWEPEENLSAELVNEYLTQQGLRKNSNKVCAAIQFHNPSPPVTLVHWGFLLCLVTIFFWSVTAWTHHRNPTLNIGTLYDCSKTEHLGLLSYPLLQNCTHSMLEDEAHVKTYKGEVLRYSPTRTKFPIYYCS